MVEIAYIAASQVPGTSANAMQTMKMAQALHDLDRDLLTIVAAGNGAADEAALRNLYGLTRAPHLVRLRASGRYGIHSFNLKAAVVTYRHGARLALSRSIGAAALAARIGIPTVFECHAPPQGFERRYWRWLVKALGFRRLVVISEALKQLLIERLPEVAELDVIVAPDGVDLAQFKGIPVASVAKRTTGRDPTRLIAGYSGHLYAGRGIDLILTCAGGLPHWNFVIAGGTEDDVAAVRAEVTRRRISNVELLGFVPNAQLAQRLAIADVLLMPYQKEVMVSGGKLDTARWMSPLKMFEYMAMGRAILASDLPALREVLDDKMARLVEPDDKDAWVAALIGLESEDARKGLAGSARDAVAQYDWRRRADLMLAGLGG